MSQPSLLVAFVIAEIAQPHLALRGADLIRTRCRHESLTACQQS